MVELVEGGDVDDHRAGHVMPEMSTEEVHHANASADTDIRICINDVTVDSTEDFGVGGCAGGGPGGGNSGVTQASSGTGDALDPELLIENLKKNRRRSSWCPEEGRKKEEKQEKQKMLAISGRRWVVKCLKYVTFRDVVT